MSPYPVQTDRESIVEAARALIERDGVDNLSLSKLASVLSIKAPSLYRHIANKEALLQAVVEDLYIRMFRAFDKGLEKAGPDPIDQLLSIAQAQRSFAHQNPNVYMLAYATRDPVLASNPNMLLEKALEVQGIIARISGEAHSLAAVRGMLAVTHGFIVLELTGQYRRGGDMAAQFAAISRAYLLGWQRQSGSA